MGARGGMAWHDIIKTWERKTSCRLSPVPPFQPSRPYQGHALTIFSIFLCSTSIPQIKARQTKKTSACLKVASRPHPDAAFSFRRQPKNPFTRPPPRSPPPPSTVRSKPDGKFNAQNSTAHVLSFRDKKKRRARGPRTRHTLTEGALDL